MAFEIQTQGARGEWAAEYISGDPDATTFATEAEAEQAIADLREHNPDYKGEYRIVEV